MTQNQLKMNTSMEFQKDFENILLIGPEKKSKIFLNLIYLVCWYLFSLIRRE